MNEANQLTPYDHEDDVSQMPKQPHLDHMNDFQRQAIETIDGPLLVLAGAGTGKTRVLTTRIGHILYLKKAYPSQILVVTFTNKAANEMRERVKAIIGEVADSLWLGTFHSICVRILRRHAEHIGYKSNFTILDSDDQVRLIKQLLKAENIDEKKWLPRSVAYTIGRWKDRAMQPHHVSARELSSSDDPTLDIYKFYQERLKILNVMDFGDIMLLTLELFKSHPDVLAHYHEQFKYILVDEYQDTNVSQYLWLRALALNHTNICCVGDDDQSIYGWRGAEVSNILRFEKDFAGATIIRLEENYRSTPHILGAAAGLISHNRGRLGKTLWTQQDAGEKVVVRAVRDGAEEARYVSEEIITLHQKGERLNSHAILVRAGFQTREFEERFITVGLPYLVVGGPRFYERQEIRDAIAYLRVVTQPDDSLAFERIINLPKRGIGTATLQTLHQYARTSQSSLYKAVQDLIETDELKDKARQVLRVLLIDFERWRARKNTLSPYELAGIVLDESGYTLMWMHDKSPEAPGRLENLKELVTALKEYESIDIFLEHISLVMENNSADSGFDKVNIMTLHASKGLEFNTVFLTGWEEDIFPSPRSIVQDNPDGLEEERRLAYVGLTRARQRASISYAAHRKMYGGWQTNQPSRFIGELPQEHIRAIKKVQFQSAPTASYYQGVSSSDTTPLAFSNRHYSSTSTGQTLFNEGQRVFHIKYGYGMIVAICDDKIDVDFQHSGIKRVISQFLQKVNN